MSDAVRSNASVSSVEPQVLRGFTTPTLTAPPRTSVDVAERARAATQVENPRLQLAPTHSRGIRIGERAPATVAQTTSIGPAPTGKLVLVDILPEQAQKAVQQSLRAVAQLEGQSAVASRNQYAPSQVFKDQLGLTHVRMNRVVDGLPVFGEQVITHLDKQGQVSSITGDTNTALPSYATKPKLSAEDASTVARRAFGETPEKATKPELVIVEADDGNHHLAYRVILIKLDEPKEPRKDDFFVDAQPGQVLFSYNEIHGFVPDWQQPAPGTVPVTPPSRTRANAVVPPGMGNSIYLGYVPLTCIGNTKALPSPRVTS